MGRKRKHPTEYTCLHCKIICKWGTSKTNKFCSMECSSSHRAVEKDAEFKQMWLAGKLPDNSGNRKRIYGWLVKSSGNRCAECNHPGTHNGKPLRLWVDHIDGDSSNNKPNNFRLVCPNCESQSETFAGRNRGKGRKQHRNSYFS